MLGHGDRLAGCDKKARRLGRTFNWQTATYGKMEYCKDEDDSFTNLKTEYPAIVFDDTSDETLSCEPTISPLDNNEIDFKISFDESDDEDYTRPRYVFLYFVKYLKKLAFKNEYGVLRFTYTPYQSIVQYAVLDDSLYGVFSVDMAPLPHRDLRHPWLRYQVEGYTEDIVHNFKHILEMIFGREVNRVRGPLVREFMLEFFSTCRMSDTEMGLDVVDTLCFQLRGGSERVILNKGDLRDYWIEISSDRDFLGAAPSYVHIRDPVRRLCYRMIAYSISGRGQEVEKVTNVDHFYLRTMDHETTNVPYLLAQYLFRHAEGRKSGARLYEGHFIGRLAAHFGLVSDEYLAWLAMRD
ncbi:hypothetical protein Tco_1040072, partial [Tanacetum coccineum]